MIGGLAPPHIGPASPAAPEAGDPAAPPAGGRDRPSLRRRLGRLRRLVPRPAAASGRLPAAPATVAAFLAATAATLSGGALGRRAAAIAHPPPRGRPGHPHRQSHGHRAPPRGPPRRHPPTAAPAACGPVAAHGRRLPGRSGRRARPRAAAAARRRWPRPRRAGRPRRRTCPVHRNDGRPGHPPGGAGPEQPALRDDSARRDPGDLSGAGAAPLARFLRHAVRPGVPQDRPLGHHFEHRRLGTDALRRIFVARRRPRRAPPAGTATA